MSEDNKITHTLDGAHGRYSIERDGDFAELTYSVASEKMVIADHTLVPEAWEGQGIGKLLLDALIRDAREKGFKIVPLCPFVNGQRRKHPEWADLFVA